MATQVEQGENLLHVEYVSEFGRTVIEPVVRAYSFYKSKMYASSMAIIQELPASDWRLAMFEWVQRRAHRASDKKVVLA
jgi:hypothetical protein